MKVELLEGNGRRIARALGRLAIAFGALAAAAVAIHPVLLAAAPLTIAVSIFYVLHVLGKPKEVIGGGELTSGPEGLRVGERALGKVREGLVLPNQREGTIVRLSTGGRLPTDLRVRSVEEGRAVLAQLGLDASRSTAQVYVRSLSLPDYRKRTRAALALPIFILATVFISILAKSAAVAIGFLGVLPFLLAMILSLAIHGRATVGADGVLMKWLWRKRFIPLEQVADARAEESGDLIMNTVPVVVRLYDRKGEVLDELLVDCVQEGPMAEAVRAEILARAEGLAERIREGIEARDKGVTTLEANVLERGERDAAAWIAHLRGLLERAQTFRDGAPPTLEALLKRVEDPAADATSRAAAAIAVTHDAEAKERVRVAAAASAEPRLRIALEAAAEGDDARLEEALDELKL